MQDMIGWGLTAGMVAIAYGLDWLIEQRRLQTGVGAGQRSGARVKRGSQPAPTGRALRLARPRLGSRRPLQAAIPASS